MCGGRGWGDVACVASSLVMCVGVTYSKGFLAIGRLPVAVAVRGMQKGRSVIDTLSVMWSLTDSQVKLHLLNLCITSSLYIDLAW